MVSELKILKLPLIRTLRFGLYVRVNSVPVRLFSDRLMDVERKEGNSTKGSELTSTNSPVASVIRSMTWVAFW